MKISLPKPKIRLPKLGFLPQGRNSFLATLFSPQVRKKLLFTLFIVLVYRLLAGIPLPGVNMAVYQQQFGGATPSDANYLLTIFTGGQLETPSIVGLGIGVYITASIMIQLLSSVIPYFQELSKDGNRGKQILDQYTRYLTIPFSFAYAFGYLFLIIRGGAVGGTNTGTSPISGLIPLNADGSLPIPNLLFMALILTAGSLLMMWLAELITENGLGNGASIMIMVGILASIPAFVTQDFSTLNVGQAISQVLSGRTEFLTDPSMLALYLVVFGSIALVVGIVLTNESVRKVTIQYARRERSGGATESFLPLKLNQSGVLPIIFASSLLSVPMILVPILQGIIPADSPLYQSLTDVQSSFLFDSSSNTYLAVYFFLIIAVSLMYATIALKPADLAENLQKSGAFVPGIRPGKSTEEYITRALLRLTFVGAFFLAGIAVIPILSNNVLSGLLDGYRFSMFSAIGGTSILIVVGVVLDTVRQIRSVQATQNYDRYI